MTASGHAIPLAVFVTASGHGGGRCSPLPASGVECSAGEPGVGCGRVWGCLLSPQPSVVSEVWLQCLLSGGECCFLISTCSDLERSWCRVAAVVSASGAWVRLCTAAFDGDSTAWVLLRLLCLAFAGSAPRRFRAGGRDRACLALDQVVRCSSTSGAEFEFWSPGTLCWSPVRSTLWQLENLSGSSSVFSRLWLRFSSSHCWSLLHWRHLSVVWPASAGVRYLSGLRAGGLPLRRRIHARVWLVACLPLLREWWTALSQYPWCFVHRPEFISGQSWPLLDFPWCGISAGLCRSSLASPFRCLSKYAPSFHWLVSPRCGCV